MTLPHFDLSSPAFFADPYRTYDQLLAQPGPVYSGAEQTWLVTRYDQVAAMLKDPRLSKQLPPEDASPLSRTMLFRDPPDHRRLRGVVGRAFSRGRVADLEHSITGHVDRLLDQVQSAGRMDFIADFALPLPVAVIAAELGVPAQDLDALQRWTAALITATAPGALTDDVQRAQRQAITSMAEYFGWVVEDRRSRPGPDLISAMAQVDQAEGSLTFEELVGTCMLLLIAGHETTVNLLGNGLYLLLSHPLQCQALRGRPELLPSAVEEILRFESPVQRGTFRVATEAIEIAGQRIEPGATVAAILGAAHRDPARFANPHQFEIGRDPNPHLAFGNGPHACIGATLARTEARLALSRLLERLPGLRLDAPRGVSPPPARWSWLPFGPRRQPATVPTGPRWCRSTMIRGLQSLPVCW